ncbi:alpha/beta fold hydrolase [Rhodopirellula sp. JC740]|uniref:Alpha/beta fold hydrolase n=1 Tax=Rhodopirellula halodulae TaxID=2894198 RepID=A0ABS8NB45_9BACT|nr:alpha/beta fold hydrolase [Rhodopirellula sp. JC740]
MSSSDALCRVGTHTEFRKHVVWFPHAGGATAPLFKQMRALSASPSTLPTLNLWAVRLAGRESRFSEPLETEMESLVDTLAHDLERQFQPDDELVLAGHSLGALIAYRLASRFLPTDAAASCPSVKGLIVMGSSPPMKWTQNRDWLDWADDAFADELDRRYGGLPAGLKDHPDALAMFLPIVRADLQLARGVSEANHPVLPVPIRAFAGADDQVANRVKMQGWQSLTQGGFSLRVLPGGHFFPLPNLSKILLTAESMLG